MKILVYGVGVLGSLYAGKLQRAGHQVTVLARGERLSELREHGLKLIDDFTGILTTVQVRVIERLDPEEAFDWVLVVVRKNQVESVLPVLAANHHTPNVLFLVNNAAGPYEMIHALGRERVVLGFPGAGGRREGPAVRYVLASRFQPTTLGELDGRISPRLEQISRALQEAELPTRFCDKMDAWLKTHAVLVTPLAGAVYLAGGDIYRLARTRDGLVLIVRSIREGMQALDQLNIPITPSGYQLLRWIPEPLLVAVLKRRLPSPHAELAIARHANTARDEMCRLAVEVRSLTRAAQTPTPAMDWLTKFCDPSVPSMPDGQSRLALNWRGVWAALAALLAFVLFMRLFNRPRRR